MAGRSFTNAGLLRGKLDYVCRNRCSRWFCGLFPPRSTSHNTGGRYDVLLNVDSAKDGMKYYVRLQSQDILNTRGWVFQEMVLSRRTVDLMSSGLYWECRGESRTETGLTFDPSSMSLSVSPIVPRDLPHFGGSWSWTWCKWKESYSRRNFTFQKDRLPALAGITRHYQQVTKSVPILGLWKNFLTDGLLWMRSQKAVQGEGTVDPTACFSPSQIPSWTWLSCPQAILYDFWRDGSSSGDGEDDLGPTMIKHHLQLIDWEVVWNSQPLVSPLKSTRLIVNALIRQIALSVTPESGRHNPPYLNVGEEKVDPAKGLFPWRCAGQFDTEMAAPTTASPMKYWCLLLRTKSSPDERLMISQAFLILEQCGDDLRCE